MNTKETLDSLFENPNYVRFYQRSYLSEERLEEETRFLIETVGIKDDMVVLDLGCGMGRHCIALSNKCRRLVGLDRSETLLDTARRNAEGVCPNVDWVCSDILDYSPGERFDLIILMNTIVGLEEDGDTIRILKNAGQWLNDRGRLCFDVINRDAVLLDFQTDGIEEDGDALMLDQLRFDPWSGRMFNRRRYVHGTDISEIEFSLKIYNGTDLRDLTLASELEILNVYSDLSGGEFSATSKKMYVVCRKS